MRRTITSTLTVLALFLLCASPLFAYNRFTGYVERGGQTALSSLNGSTVSVQRSYPGASVTVRISGTATTATIYSTSGGAAKANPFTASSRGYYDFWAPNTAYDLLFTSGGDSWTIHIGASSSSGTGVNVTDYGTITYGTSATAGQQTANAAAFNAAITYAGANNLQLYPPCGTMLINDEIVSAVAVSIVGCGVNGTRILQTAANKTVFTLGHASTIIVGGWSMSGMLLATADGSSDALWLRNMQMAVLRDITIVATGRNGVRLTNVQETRAYHVNNEVAAPAITGMNGRFGDDLLSTSTPLTGTATFTNASANVTGVGTAFDTEIVAGDRLVVNGASATVQSVTNATALVLTAVWGGTTYAGAISNEYLTGTLTFTTGSANVTGASSLFTTQLSAGDIITANGYDVRVLAVGGAGTLTLDANWTAPSFVGRAAQEPYPLSGTLTFTYPNSNSVTGVGTAFTTELRSGSIIRANGVWGVVDSVTSNTALTLLSNWYGPASFSGPAVREREGAAWQLDGTTTTLELHGCSVDGVPYGVRSVAAGGLALHWTGTAQSIWQRALHHSNGTANVNLDLYLDGDAVQAGTKGGGFYLKDGRASRIYARNGDAGGVTLVGCYNVEVVGSMGMCDIDATSRRNYIHDNNALGAISVVGAPGYFRNLSPDTKIERVYAGNATLQYGSIDGRAVTSIYPARGFERWNGTALPNGFALRNSGATTVSREGGAGLFYGGTYSAKAVVGAVQDGLQFVLAPTENFRGRIVTVRGWYKTTVTGKSALVTFFYTGTEANATLYETLGAWAPFEVSFAAPTDATSMSFVLSGITGATVYYDEVDILTDGVGVPATRTNAGDTPNLLAATSVHTGYIKLANAGATTVTAITGGYSGVPYTFELDANTTLQNNATIVLRGAANKAGTGMRIPMIYDSEAAIWYQAGYESTP